MTIELLLPLELFWELKRLVKKADFLLASQEQTTDIQDIYRSLFKKAAPFATKEVSRAWLYKRSGKG